MSLVHLHLLLNHVPVIGTVFATALLAIAALRRSSELAKAALVAFAVLAVVGAVVYVTGEPAEEAVERLPGFSEAVMERHEEAAAVSAIALGALGAAAAALVWRFRGRGLPRWATLGTLAGGVLVTALMGWTANLGGQIRHTEIRSGVAAAAAASAATAQPSGGGDEGERH